MSRFSLRQLPLSIPGALSLARKTHKNLAFFPCAHRFFEKNRNFTAEMWF